MIMVKRIKLGPTDDKISYSWEKMKELIELDTFKHKTVPEYRNKVINAYHKYALDKININYKGSWTEERYRKRKKYLYNFFSDYLKDRSKKERQKFMLHFF